MKKLFIALLIICMLLSAGCGPAKHSITIAEDFPNENELAASYRAGEEVTIKLATITEHYYVLSVNGEAQRQTSMDMEYTYFTFTMPDEDVLITIDRVGVDIPEAP